MAHTMTGRMRVTAALLGILGLNVAIRAHDIPSDVRIRAFLKPEGSTLRLVVRAPMASMNDIFWPMLGPYVDFSDPRMPLALRDGAIQWIGDRIDVYEDDRRLGEGKLTAVRVSLPSDVSFDSYDAAVSGLARPPLAKDVELPRAQAMVDATFEYAIQSDRSRFSINPHYRLLGLRTLTVLTFVGQDRAERTFQFHDDPGLVHLDPRWHQAAQMFIAEGFWHVLNGPDHLLFLFCLVVPLRRVRSLFWVATSFIVSHTITLVAASYDMVPAAGWFSPLVQLLIALTILYLALENIVAPSTGRRWMLAFGFGLVHGLELAIAFRETLQLAGSHVLFSLAVFNVGAEIAQLLALAVMAPMIALLFRFGAPERASTVVVSAVIAHTAWHWTMARGQILWRYQFGWPDFTPAFFADATRWLMVGVAAAGAAWLIKAFADPGREMQRAAAPSAQPNPDALS
jgi:hypothetical protein